MYAFGLLAGLIALTVSRVGYRARIEVALLWAVLAAVLVVGALLLVGGGTDPIAHPHPQTVESYQQIKGANRKD